MLFNPAHTVLNQRANARKASVETTNLIGHWDPNDTNSYSGSGTTYNNLVSAKEDLKIYGATFVNTSPKHFTFDGTNDKIADIDVTDPYNDNFQVDARKSFAISMWLKFDNFTNSNILWTLGDGNGPALIDAYMSSSQKDRVEFTLGSNSHNIKNKLSAGIWYMITFRLRHPEANKAVVDLFLDGIPMEVGSLDSYGSGGWPPMGSNYITATAVAANDLDIGYNESESAYINSATKLGLVLVHQSTVAGNCLPNSAIWTNYLATKDTYK
jgi:hypothetical protein